MIRRAGDARPRRPRRPDASMKEYPIRHLFWSILAITMISTTTPLHAQVYDSSYPVCLEAYGRTGGYSDCSYASMAQCQATAPGRATSCIANPCLASGERRKYRGY